MGGWLRGDSKREAVGRQPCAGFVTLNSCGGSAGRFTRAVRAGATDAYARECTVRALTFGGKPRRACRAISP